MVVELLVVNVYFVEVLSDVVIQGFAVGIDIEVLDNVTEDVSAAVMIALDSSTLIP